MMRLIVILGLVAPPALADVTTPGGRVIECYCTDSTGGRVEMGEEICLFVDGRAFIARCEMALNNPIWRDTGRGCVSSRLPEGLQPALDPASIDAQI
nr:hypothetical protein [Actibacterium sp. MT2.3-13A]